VTNYELLQRRPEGVAIVATVSAGTLAQATRKLYRSKGLQAPQAPAQGYFVQPQPKGKVFNQPQENSHGN
jgi:hypothetical protein